MKIIQYPSGTLYQSSEPVAQFDNKLSSLIETMIALCKRTDNCVGLAAIQIGVSLRLSVLKGADGFFEIINPEIKATADYKIKEWEGCMSCGKGGDQLFAEIERYGSVLASWQDRRGRRNKERLLNGSLARIFQHEVDHMNGKLFLAHVKDPSKIFKAKQLFAPS